MTSTQAAHAGRIVVGVDGSRSSNDAVVWAARQAELTGAKLELVTAWEWPMTYGSPIAFPPDYDPAGGAQKVLDEVAATVRAQHPGLDVHATAEEGHPAPLLVAASEGADLLVVGCRGHGEFVGMVIGSVSEHCVTNAHCPVLVLREE
jgi:nucleotide-binding universal stress UspA family protein